MIMKPKKDTYKLVFNMWMSHRYESKIDLIKFLIDKYNYDSEISEVVSDVLTNIDKYKEEFKQTKEEQFFIEFQKLLQKYGVEIFIADNDDKDETLVFQFPVKQFELSGNTGTELTETNTFVNVEDESEFYEFPGEQYFEEQGIDVRNE